MEELKLSQDSVQYTKPVVNFADFNYFLAMAGQVADYISRLELTEDNIKDVKKDLARARKLTKALNDERIRIKREINEPLAVFESQVKEITGVVDEAEEKLRSKVREVEEKEREDKKEQLYEIWQKRAGLYELPQMLPNAFELWLTPQHLNKTTSLRSAEDDMVTWLEEKQRELDTLHSMDDEYMVEYLSTLNLADAINAVHEREERYDAVHAASDEEVATFIITGAANIKFTEMLLNTNNINFTRR